MIMNSCWSTLLGIVAAVCGSQLVAQTHSALPVERLDGSVLSVANFREHRATAIVFLSSRSAESIAAVDAIRKTNDRNRRRKVMFAGVFPNPAESGDEVREFCQASGFVFPCYRDPKHKTVEQLGAHVTPEAFVFDNAGTVVYSGSVFGLEAAVDDIVNDAKVRTATMPPAGTPIDRPSAARKIDDPFGTIVYSSELIFEKIPGAPAHHASSMTVAANGDLLVTWYGGSYESSDDESLYLARRRKGSRSWDKPIMLLRNPVQPVGNAVIFTVKSGAIWIIWGRMEASQPHVGAHRMGRDSADVPSLKRRRQDMVC